MSKKNIEKSNKLNKVYIIVTILYTLVFCYCAYVLIIMPEKLDIMNFVILGILVIPYLIRLFSKNLIPAAIVLEIIFIIFIGIVYVTWPTIKSSISYDCGWGDMD